MEQRGRWGERGHVAGNTIRFYCAKIQEMNHLYYWHGLDETQARAGWINEALQTINAALAFYPSREEFLKKSIFLTLLIRGKTICLNYITGMIEGWVNPLSGLYPIDFDRDGTYELEAHQTIAGRYSDICRPS